MKILGIHGESHDACAALLIDGEIVSAIEEERLSRIKHDPRFPGLAIKHVLSSSGVDLSEIDMVVIDLVGRTRKKLERKVAELGIQCPVKFIRHHDSHAAGTFFSSDFEDAAIMIVDGHGSRAIELPELDTQPYYLHYDTEIPHHELASFYRGHGSDLTLIRQTVGGKNYRNGIGLLYVLGSLILNFGELGAGKLMGLSAFGTENPLFDKPILEVFNGLDAVFAGNDKITDNINYYAEKYFGGVKVRQAELLPDVTYTDLAFKVQKEMENAMLILANQLFSITRSQSLCLGGGCALNGIVNMLISKKTGFENVFILPPSNDKGCAIGNALYGWHVISKNQSKHPIYDVYLGGHYEDDATIRILEDHSTKATFERCENIFEVASNYLSNGHIVGWFQGRSEVGPRALGNRSILADPRSLSMKDKLNKVKGRELFRPLAPSIIEEFCSNYFDFNGTSSYMLLIASSTEIAKITIPAALHVDGTARLHTVNKNINPRFYKLIDAFKDRTGVPVLLNTSFNLAGEPIVETPVDAIKCFLESEIDVLVIGNYLIKRTTNA
jgi:carbamoyltransferase